mmetsp:Transcript_29198/g.94192  ORF Transcript_29198/g.94192 Transcript_29198/m.94192 type:complete len:246 (-) Transcript_29198:79-816(-)|eukprot:CAMPEP_0118910388 /NCGR_PEP_ID=MMETSP1166-20130328/12551_1 /TAXON_ID=1104430 /ORGANISM="Chrysoreinhardia sp, Strain CCMP3193" /LENGTH=245 /DNA_ID=CAMNT_0006849851 /DNA_START=131 /DNA_END=868 /DNA_ORIENTATION=+
MLQCGAILCCESNEQQEEDSRGYPRDEVDRRRRVSPTAERNKEALRAVLTKHLTSRARVLEVASGTGQHASYLASLNPSMSFQPSEFRGFASHRFEEHDVDDALRSIDAYCEDLDNVAKAVALDVAASEWPVEKKKQHFDAVLAVDLFHVSSPAVKDGLFAGANRVLKKSRGLVFVYGAFAVDGDLLTPSNKILDEDLRRSGHPGWGIVDAKDVDAIAAKYGFESIAKEHTPEHTLCLVYAKCAK